MCFQYGVSSSYPIYYHHSSSYAHHHLFLKYSFIIESHDIIRNLLRCRHHSSPSSSQYLIITIIIICLCSGSYTVTADTFKLCSRPAALQRSSAHEFWPCQRVDITSNLMVLTTLVDWCCLNSEYHVNNHGTTKATMCLAANYLIDSKKDVSLKVAGCKLLTAHSMVYYDLLCTPFNAQHRHSSIQTATNPAYDGTLLPTQLTGRAPTKLPWNNMFLLPEFVS